jgi:hypothetical protein
LSPENIETMEKMMIEQGMNPGIHSHKDINNMTLEELKAVMMTLMTMTMMMMRRRRRRM